jgi:hypothetical protein
MNYVILYLTFNPNDFIELCWFIIYFHARIIGNARDMAFMEQLSTYSLSLSLSLSLSIYIYIYMMRTCDIVEGGRKRTLLIELKSR